MNKQLSDAFQRGQKAFNTGDFQSPYKAESLPQKEFDRGFNVAYFENLERVKAQEEAGSYGS